MTIVQWLTNLDVSYFGILPNRKKVSYLKTVNNLNLVSISIVKNEIFIQLRIEATDLCHP